MLRKYEIEGQFSKKRCYASHPLLGELHANGFYINFVIGDMHAIVRRLRPMKSFLLLVGDNKVIVSWRWLRYCSLIGHSPLQSIRKRNDNLLESWLQGFVDHLALVASSGWPDQYWSRAVVAGVYAEIWQWGDVPQNDKLMYNPVDPNRPQIRTIPWHRLHLSSILKKDSF